MSGSSWHRLLYPGLLLFGLSLPLSKSASAILLAALCLAALIGAISSKEFRDDLRRGCHQPLTAALALFSLVAYLGIIIAATTGLAIVLGVPLFRDSLIWATLFYGMYLLVMSRVLPAILGGYFGDRMGYEKARAKTREAWAEWVAKRDQPQRTTKR